MTVLDALLTTLVMGLVTFATRLFPFVVFRRHRPGPLFRRLQAQLPAMIMLILVVYSVKDADWGHWLPALSSLLCVAVAAGLQWWRRNALISIFGATGLYMLISAVLAGY